MRREVEFLYVGGTVEVLFLDDDQLEYVQTMAERAWNDEDESVSRGKFAGKPFAFRVKTDAGRRTLINLRHVVRIRDLGSS